MLKGDQIAEADLTGWRKLAQGLHARYLVGDFAAALAAGGTVVDDSGAPGLTVIADQDGNRGDRQHEGGRPPATPFM